MTSSVMVCATAAGHLVVRIELPPSADSHAKQELWDEADRLRRWYEKNYAPADRRPPGGDA